MNTSKKNTILLVLLVVQAALIAFLYRPGQNAAPIAATLIKGLVPDQLTAMTITDDQGKTINLVKKEGWQVDPGDYPADQAKIEGLIKKIADMKSSRLVSQTKASHLRLKVADAGFNRKIELKQGDKKTVFFLGTAPSSKSIHLRLDGAKEVYQINDLSAWEVQTDKESWWRTKYLGQAADKLTGLSVTNAAGQIELVKDEKKGWQLKGSPDVKLDAARVESLITSVNEMTIASYLAKDFTPKAKPIATITCQTKDGSTTMQIWAKDKQGDGDQVVKASNSSFYAKAKDYAVKVVLEAKLDGLKAKPVPESTATGAENTTPVPPLPAQADQPSSPQAPSSPAGN